MTDHEDPIAFKRNDAPGFFYGVPNRDLTVREAAALPPDLRRDVEAGTLYVEAELTPAQKAARTREANQAREDAEQAEAERRKAEADAAKQAADDETGTGDQ